MSAKIPWAMRALSIITIFAAAGCFGARLLPMFNGESAALVTADLLLPKAAQEVYAEGSPSQEEQLIEMDSLTTEVPQATATPEPTPSATPEPTPVPTPKPGAKAYEISETQMGGGEQVENFYIRNSTKQDLDFSSELEEKPDLDIKADGTPMVLIYHTHTTEGYLEEESAWYYEGTPTRSQDESKNVVMVWNAI